MNKYIVTLFVILGLTSCAAKDERYYQTHAKELQKAIKACPEQQPSKSMSCQQLEVVAKRMNYLGYQLQSGPQEFGKKIIELQEIIPQQELQLKNKGSDSELQASLEQNRRELAEYLAVVKWLESPVS